MINSLLCKHNSEKVQVEGVTTMWSNIYILILFIDMWPYLTGLKNAHLFYIWRYCLMIFHPWSLYNFIWPQFFKKNLPRVNYNIVSLPDKWVIGNNDFIFYSIFFAKCTQTFKVPVLDVVGCFYFDAHSWSPKMK